MLAAGFETALNSTLDVYRELRHDNRNGGKAGLCTGADEGRGDQRQDT
jgi:hypothetical protein